MFSLCQVSIFRVKKPKKAPKENNKKKLESFQAAISPMAVCCWCSQVSKRRFLSQLCILHRAIMRLRRVKESKDTWLLWDLLLHNLIPERKCCCWVCRIINTQLWLLGQKPLYWLLQSKISLSCSKAMMTISKSRTWCSPPAFVYHRWYRCKIFSFFFQHLHYLRSICGPHFAGEDEYCVTFLRLFHHQISPIHKKAIPFLIIITWLCCESKTIQTYQSI